MAEASQAVDQGALRWLREGLDETIQLARGNLEEYIEGEGSSDCMIESVRLLHQVHGTLRMAQVYGAGMLVEEMEQVAQAILDKTVSQEQDAAEALMLGLVQLPIYLERLESGEPDIPLVLMPLINDLRITRSAPAVSEVSLFAPKLRQIIEAEPVTHGSGNSVLPAVIKQLRPQYHKGLLSWYQGQQSGSGINQLLNVLQSINARASTLRLRRLLDAAEAMLLSIKEDDAEVTPAVKQLFSRLDQHFKDIIALGEEDAEKNFPLELLRNILYYVARSPSSNPVVRGVQQSVDAANRFAEASAAQTEHGLIPPGRELLDAVSEVLKQDLLTVKDHLDLYIRGDRSDLGRLTEITRLLQRVGDTLGMVGSGELHNQVKNCSEQLQSAQQTDTLPTDDELMAIATDILSVESALAGLSSSFASDKSPQSATGLIGHGVSEFEMKGYTEALIKEAFSEFSQVKDKVDDYLQNTVVEVSLADVPDLIHKISNVLAMADLRAVVDLLDAVHPYFSALSERRITRPNFSEREAVVDVLASVEYYLESLLEGNSNLSGILAFARPALEKLRLDDKHPRVEVVEQEKAEQTDSAVDEIMPSEAEADNLTEDEAALSQPGSDEEPEPGFAEFSVDTEDEAKPSAETSADDSLLILDEADLAEEEKALFRAGLDDDLDLDLAEFELDTEPGVRHADMSIDDALLTLDKTDLNGGYELAQQTGSDEDLDLVESGLHEVQDQELAEDLNETGVADTSVTEDVDNAAAEQLVAVEETASAEDDESGKSIIELDPEIFGIFMDEAEGELEAIQQEYPIWRDDPGNHQAMQNLRRSFHTLKGSGRLVGADSIGEFAWSIENLLNRVIDDAVEPTPSLFEFLDKACAFLPKLIQAQAKNRPTPVEASELEAKAHALADPGARLSSGIDAEVESVQEFDPQAFDVEDVPDELLLDDLQQPDESSQLLDSDKLLLDETDDASELLPSSNLQMEIQAALDDVISNDDTDELEDLSLDELPEVADEVIPEELDDWKVDTVPVVPEITVSEDVAEIDSTPEMVMVSESYSEEPAPIALDPELYDIFRAESEAYLKKISEFVSDCRSQGQDCEITEELTRILHTLRGSSRTAGVEPMAVLCDALEIYTSRLIKYGRRGNSEFVDLLEHTHHVIRALLRAINVAGAELPDWSPVVHQISEMTRVLEESVVSESAADKQPGKKKKKKKNKAGTAEAQQPEAKKSTDADSELVAIFLEEALELMEQLEHAYSEWSADLSGKNAMEEFQRSLHTIKGGARMAGFTSLGDLGHALESLFESIVEGRIEPHKDIQSLVRQALDQLAHVLEQLEADGVLSEISPMTHQVESAARGEIWQVQEPIESMLSEESELTDDISLDDSEALDVDTNFFTDSQLLTDSELLADSQLQLQQLSEEIYSDQRNTSVIKFPGAKRPLPGQESIRPDKRPPPLQAEAKQTGSKEQVRIGSESLDQMVNYAGEVSIYRARMEQQNTSMGYSLEELGQTITRLREQLRALEIETEAQVLSRHEREFERDVYEEFDPLEMDRYSNIQQLSRALSETVNDLTSIGDTISNNNRDSDTLLLQQSRVTNDLQDALLRTRMVPLRNQVSRLQRVVRQSCQSMGKKAEFSVEGGAGEMDRTILNRMIGPFEHILRNAVAHGIEPPEEREAAGKPGTGKIIMSLTREGADVIITIKDDGAGLNRDLIRAKAIEKGLLQAETEISDDALYQYIMEPGFSTANELSQTSGRGVGMDVVLSEIKQLGGALVIHSQPGEGTKFVINLPFTLAISEALLVKVTEDIFAVPHGSIEGMIRASRDELLECYTGEREGIEYDGQMYGVRNLGALLGMSVPYLSEANRWFPLLMVKSGERRIAVQADAVVGNRQIVVKSIGPQLSSVRWFTGGTILPDGRIALILDINALVRTASSSQQTEMISELMDQEDEQGASVMVVDDSITVRKVTSRLLERHNMQVLTAKDGLDALSLLQDHKPDVILLDIEMPRMDGFELARHLKNSADLAGIPVIMITSRTGEKHRDRAIELGVKRYLGKPYQEADLLENIYSVLSDKADV